MLMVPVAASTLIAGPAVAAGAGEAFGAAVEPEQAESSRATIRTGFKCSPFSRDGIRPVLGNAQEPEKRLTTPKGGGTEGARPCVDAAERGRLGLGGNHLCPRRQTSPISSLPGAAAIKVL